MPEMVKKTKKHNPGKSKQGSDSDIAQRATVKALLGTFNPTEVIEAASQINDADTILDIVYSAANHANIRLKNVSDDDGARSPEEIRVKVEHDPNVAGEEIGYSFMRAIFTIYTNKDPAQVIKMGRQQMRFGDYLTSTIIDRLPSAGTRNFFTLGEICASGNPDSYIKEYLPKALKKTQKKKKRRTQTNRNKKQNTEGRSRKSKRKKNTVRRKDK